MQDITELQRRLTAALDRIGSGLDRLGAVSDGTEASDHQSLSAELEAERTRVRELEDRLEDSRDRTGMRAPDIEAELKRCRALLESVEADRNRLKAGNDALRAALRAAQAAGDIADADAVNATMAAELDALRQVRESDRTELDAVLTALDTALQQQGAQGHA